MLRREPVTVKTWGAAARPHYSHSHNIGSRPFSAIRQESAWLLSNLVVGQTQLVEMVIAAGLLPQINALFAGTAGERREVGVSLSLSCRWLSQSISTPHLLSLRCKSATLL